MTKKAPLSGDSVDVSGQVGLVKSAIKQFLPPQRNQLAYDYDDLVQAGLLGLLQHKHRWDPARGSWSTFAYPVVRHAVTDYVRKSTELFRDSSTVSRRTHSFQDLIRSWGVDAGPEMYGHVQEDECAFEWREAWMWCVKDFDGRTQRILRMRFVEGARLVAISEVFGVSQSRIRQIIRQVKERFVARVISAGIRP